MEKVEFVYVVLYWNGNFKLYKTKALAKKSLAKYFYSKEEDEYYISKEDFERDVERGEYFARITKRQVI